jgi:DNA polymerase III subunit chi
MRVDFYQLGRDPAEQVIPQLARATLLAGERLLVVSSDADQLGRIGKLLWERLPDAFLAHGQAGDRHALRQPILLAEGCTPENGARYILLADGEWRGEAAGFERSFLLFGEQTLQAARACWSALGRQEGMERHFWRQDGGKWLEQA